MLPENQLLQWRCSSAVGTECSCILLLPHCLSLLLELATCLDRLMAMPCPSGYFLFRWKRSTLSLDSVLALQISWPLSSRSTSLRVDWKSESDSCHLLPMRCFFSVFSREPSILLCSCPHIFEVAHRWHTGDGLICWGFELSRCDSRYSSSSFSSTNMRVPRNGSTALVPELCFLTRPKLASSVTVISLDMLGTWSHHLIVGKDLPDFFVGSGDA